MSQDTKNCSKAASVTFGSDDFWPPKADSKIYQQQIELHRFFFQILLRKKKLFRLSSITNLMYYLSIITSILTLKLGLANMLTSIRIENSSISFVEKLTLCNYAIGASTIRHITQHTSQSISSIFQILGRQI